MDFKNRIRIKIKALNQESFFNKVLTQKVKIFNLKRNDKETEFDVNMKDMSTIKSTLDMHNIEILSLQEGGGVVLKKNILARLCIPIAALIMIVGLFLSNLFVMQVSINGCDKINKDSIVKLLSDNGISGISSKGNIDCSKIELLILENFEQVSLVSASCIGCSLVINIKEKAEDLSTEVKSDIVADFEGRLLSLEVHFGEAQVKTGDIVRVGDILVKGITDPESGRVQPAKAKVKAEVWQQSSIVVPLEKVELQKTGKVQNFRTVEVFGKTIYSNRSECRFDNFIENIQTERKLGAILPITITYYTYEEVTENVVSVDFEVEKEKYIEECRQIALQTLKNSDIILNERCFVTNEASFNQINYVLTLERNLIWS